MTRRPVYSYRDGAGRTGRAFAAGIAKLLEQGRRLTVQRVDRQVTPLELAVRIARAEVGTLEVPRDSNTGPRVRQYQDATNVGGTRWPWCVAFGLWVWDQAGIKHDGYRGGYAPHLEFWAKKAGRWRTGRPKPGWIVLFGWGKTGVADHAGIVEHVHADGHPSTIEGNTQPGAAGDQSNGGGVYARSDRTIPTIRGYVAA